MKIVYLMLAFAVLPLVLIPLLACLLYGKEHK